MTGRTTARRSCRLGRDHSFAVDAAPKGRSAVVAISGSVGYDSPLARAIAFTFQKGRRCTNAHDPDRPLSPSSRPARHPRRRGRRAGRQRGTRSEIRHQQGELPRPPTGGLIVLSESLAFPNLEGARGHLGSALLRTRCASLTARRPASPVFAKPRSEARTPFVAIRMTRLVTEQASPLWQSARGDVDARHAVVAEAKAAPPGGSATEAIDDRQTSNRATIGMPTPLPAPALRSHAGTMASGSLGMLCGEP